MHYVLIICIMASDCFVCSFTSAYVCLFWVWFFLFHYHASYGCKFPYQCSGKNRFPNLLVLTPKGESYGKSSYFGETLDWPVNQYGSARLVESMVSWCFFI